MTEKPFTICSILLNIFIQLFKFFHQLWHWTHGIDFNIYKKQFEKRATQIIPSFQNVNWVLPCHVFNIITLLNKCPLWDRSVWLTCLYFLRTSSDTVSTVWFALERCVPVQQFVLPLSTELVLQIQFSLLR